MNKLRLDLEALSVESFDTSHAGWMTRGTIRGAMVSPVPIPTYPVPVTDGTCAGGSTCGGYTCDATCGNGSNCVGTMVDSCKDTCDANACGTWGSCAENCTQVSYCATIDC
jgi:hypothetical protein